MSQMQFHDRVKDTSSTTGTGSFTLDVATIAGYRPFDGVVYDSRDFFYVIETAAGEWETGVGRYDNATNVLSRNTIIANSNGNTSAVNFAAGTKTVFLTAGHHFFRGVALPFEGTWDVATNTDIPNLATNAKLAVGYGSVASANNALAIYGTASGTASIAIGGTASGSDSIAVGAGSATAANALAFGTGTAAAQGAVVVGAGTASGLYSVLLGCQGTPTTSTGGSGNHSYCAYGYGRSPFARYAFSATFGVAGSGNARHEVSFEKLTANATPTKLELGGSAATYGYLQVNGPKLVGFHGIVTAANTTDQAVYEVKGAVYYNGSSVPALVGTPTVTTLAETAGATAWDVAIVLDGGNNAFAPEVTGAAATSINWHASLNLTQVNAS